MAKDYEEYASEALNWRDNKGTANHNKTDFSAFKEAQRKDRERSEIRYKRRMKEVIAENLKNWEDSITNRWKEADLKTVDTKQGEKIIDSIDKHGLCSFYFYGNTGIGKSYHAYAIIREYIRRGYFAPSQAVILNEGQMLDWVNTGFEGRNKLNSVLNDRHKFFFFDDIGRGSIGTQDKRNALWDRVMDYVYSKDVAFVMTSNFEIKELTDNFSDASFDRLMLETHQRRIRFSGDNYRHEIARNQSKNDVSDKS